MRALPALAVLLALSACGAPGTVHLAATAVADLNPGPGGAAFPAQVRLYQLTDATRFNNADYFQLADHESDVLGSTLVKREEFILHPRDRRTIDVPIDKGTKVLGVAVAFRNIKLAKWRATVPVEASTVRLTLGPDSVSLAP